MNLNNTIGLNSTICPILVSIYSITVMLIQFEGVHFVRVLSDLKAGHSVYYYCTTTVLHCYLRVDLIISCSKWREKCYKQFVLYPFYLSLKEMFVHNS